MEETKHALRVENARYLREATIAIQQTKEKVKELERLSIAYEAGLSQVLLALTGETSSEWDITNIDGIDYLVKQNKVD